jgi:mRNA interferase HigB
MRVIAHNTLVAFSDVHPATKASLSHWYRVAKAAKWASTREVLATFSKAKVLNAERVRFEVSGGDYRLIVAFDFRRQIAYVKFIGTHAQYDAVDALTVSLY